MKSKEFFGKFASLYLWGNILAMAIVVVLVCVGVKYGLDVYTRHGEAIPVPDLRNMNYSSAKVLIEQDGLCIEVTDSGHNKRLPADCVLSQTPAYGTKVKMGHTIYVTVNSKSSPTIAIPDIVDNSSLRAATMKLKNMGFKLLDPKYIPGEKDWVYGILAGGRRLSTGDRVPIETSLTLEVGSGHYDDEADDIDYTDPIYDTGEESEFDDFEEVTEPPLME